MRNSLFTADTKPVGMFAGTTVLCTLFQCTLYTVVVFFTSVAAADQRIAVSAGGQITVYQPESDGQLSTVQSIDLNGNSGPMGLSQDHRFLYVNTSLPTTGEGRKQQAALATFAIAEDGKINHLHTAPSGWTTGYVSIDASGKFLAGNSYGEGKVGIWTLADDGTYRGAPPFDFELEKRAHSAVFSADNRFLFVPATGPNKIFQLVFNSVTGSIHPNQPSSAPGPRSADQARQPRHLIFHPDLPMAYTTNEREQPGAGVWRYDSETGLLESIQGIVSVPGDTQGMTTADLHLSKDGRFLYVSNRDIANRNQPEGRDSIALFAIAADSGELDHIKNFPSERIPRSFAIGLKGNYLYVSGQGDNRLGVYRIDSDNGHLQPKAKYDLPGKPSWVSVIPGK